VEAQEATAEMERAIACLVLELPAEVWGDVRDRWHRARDSWRALSPDPQHADPGREVVEAATEFERTFWDQSLGYREQFGWPERDLLFAALASDQSQPESQSQESGG